jgi:hypothetical protein
MKTTGETGSVKFSTKYCSSNLKHGSFDLYEQYPVFTGFLKPAMNMASRNRRLLLRDRVSVAMIEGQHSY